MEQRVPVHTANRDSIRILTTVFRIFEGEMIRKFVKFEEQDGQSIHTRVTRFYFEVRRRPVQPLTASLNLISRVSCRHAARFITPPNQGCSKPDRLWAPYMNSFNRLQKKTIWLQ